MNAPDPICVLDAKGHCERHREVHVGARATLSQDPGPKGQSARRTWDKIVDGSIRDHLPVPPRFAIGVRAKLSDCPNWGVGAELKDVAAEFGRSESAGCGCAELMCEMDQAGVEAVRSDLDGYAKKLRANAKQFGWAEWYQTGKRAVASGIVSKSLWHLVDWNRKYREMIEEAIRRAELRGPKPRLPQGTTIALTGRPAASMSASEGGWQSSPPAPLPDDKGAA